MVELVVEPLTLPKPRTSAAGKSSAFANGDVMTVNTNAKRRRYELF